MSKIYIVHNNHYLIEDISVCYKIKEVISKGN